MFFVVEVIIVLIVW